MVCFHFRFQRQADFRGLHRLADVDLEIDLPSWTSKPSLSFPSLPSDAA